MPALKEKTVAPQQAQAERHKPAVSDAVHKIKPVTAEKTEQKVLAKEEQVQQARKEIAGYKRDRIYGGAFALFFSTAAAVSAIAFTYLILNPPILAATATETMVGVILGGLSIVIPSMLLAGVGIQIFREDNAKLHKAEGKLAEVAKG